MCPRSLTLTPELVISVHPFSPYTHSLSVQVRGLFACSAASTVKYIEHLGHLEDTALGELAFSFGRMAIREMNVLEAPPLPTHGKAVLIS